jgi:hypothetical protein
VRIAATARVIIRSFSADARRGFLFELVDSYIHHGDQVDNKAVKAENKQAAAPRAPFFLVIVVEFFKALASRLLRQAPLQLQRIVAQCTNSMCVSA